MGNYTNFKDIKLKNCFDKGINNGLAIELDKSREYLYASSPKTNLNFMIGLAVFFGCCWRKSPKEVRTETNKIKVKQELIEWINSYYDLKYPTEFAYHLDVTLVLPNESNIDILVNVLEEAGETDATYGDLITHYCGFNKLLVPGIHKNIDDISVREFIEGFSLFCGSEELIINTICNLADTPLGVTDGK